MDKFAFKYCIGRGTPYEKLIHKVLEKKHYNDLSVLLKRAKNLNFEFAVKRIAQNWKKFADCGHRWIDNEQFFLTHKYVWPFSNEKGRKLISNGIIGYFEKITHSGFRLNDLLCESGLISEGETYRKKWEGDGSSYCHLSKATIDKIAKACDISEKEVDWIAFKICFSLASADTHEEMGTEFDVECGAPTSKYFIAGIAKEYLPIDMQIFLKEKFQLPIETVPAV